MESERDEPVFTGRYLVLLREDAGREGVRALESLTGVQVMSIDEVSDSESISEGSEALVIDPLGVAVVSIPPDQAGIMSVDSAIEAIESERYVYALADDGDYAQPPAQEGPFDLSAGPTREYLLGYRDAVNHLVDGVLGASALSAAAGYDESQNTWGLQVTNVASSTFSGADTQVAVLDTGLDLNHPDFAGRHITTQSFVVGERVQDGHGHGTHCLGTACGPRQPAQLPGYGVAYDSSPFVGKVLNNRGRGTDGTVLAGIGWAEQHDCLVVSMSLVLRSTIPGSAIRRYLRRPHSAPWLAGRSS